MLVALPGAGGQLRATADQTAAPVFVLVGLQQPSGKDPQADDETSAIAKALRKSGVAVTELTQIDSIDAASRANDICVSQHAQALLIPIVRAEQQIKRLPFMQTAHPTHVVMQLNAIGCDRTLFWRDVAVREANPVGNNAGAVIVDLAEQTANELAAKFADSVSKNPVHLTSPVPAGLQQNSALSGPILVVPFQQPDFDDPAAKGYTKIVEDGLTALKKQHVTAEPMPIVASVGRATESCLKYNVGELLVSTLRTEQTNRYNSFTGMKTNTTHAEARLHRLDCAGHLQKVAVSTGDANSHGYSLLPYVANGDTAGVSEAAQRSITSALTELYGSP